VEINIERDKNKKGKKEIGMEKKVTE
jgi:hypothetical protein